MNLPPVITVLYQARPQGEWMAVLFGQQPFFISKEAYQLPGWSLLPAKYVLVSQRCVR